MPDRCVVFGCSNLANVEKGISLHRIPFFNDERSEAKRRRKRWINFVCATRDKWIATKNSAVCSQHFTAESFSRTFCTLSESESHFSPRLTRDDIGIVAYPTIHTKVDKELTTRDLRMIKRKWMSGEKAYDLPSTSNASFDDLPSATTSINASVDDLPSTSIASLGDEPELQTPESEPQFMEEKAPADDEPLLDKQYDLSPSYRFGPVVEKLAVECKNCAILEKEIRHYKNLWLGAKHKLRLSRAELNNSKINSTQIDDNNSMDAASTISSILAEDNWQDLECNEKFESSDPVESEPETDCEDEVMYETETDEDQMYSDMETDTELPKTYKRVLNSESNLRTEPKFIVFLTQLLDLFKFCPSCKSDDVLVNVVENGTMAQVKVSCANQKCGKKDSTWNSQPYMTGTSIPAGNLLLSFGILTSGTSATKVTRALQHMGLSCISLRTYFLHQREKLYPALLIYWKAYQAKMIENVKACQKPLTVAGDGRHDSMGHSAKYCAYTTLCCTVPQIIDFSLVQRNEVGNSTGMEFEGFQRSMGFLESEKLPISTLITDRHSKIAKHMREKQPNITHYFDLWHLTKKVTKVLAKIAKYAGCESLLEWIKPCSNHLYWSATTTHSGNGKVIVAKFKSFLGHVKNQHSGFSDPLFDQCAHGPTMQPRKWLNEDSVAYNKMYVALTKPRLIAGIMKASPLSQTSSLEGFHSVVNQFSPKMISYSFPGMFCRHVLAVVHFNSNLDRENCEINGTTQVKVHYPKFKNGEAVVRNVKVAQNFEYVEDIYQVMLSAIQEGKLAKARKEIQEMTPLPMNTMLEKQSKAEAILKKARRQNMTTADIPPTNPVEEAETTPATSAGQKKDRAKPRCTVCKNFMAGHKNVSNCPRNQGPNNTT